jgi:hypothetical protein
MRQGILAEFAAPEPMLHAIVELRHLGYRHIDAFTPYPVKGTEAALGEKRSPINWLVLPFALAGASLAYVVEWWCNAYDYPLNVGGRPLHSAPAFVPITFEMGVLAASLGGVLLFLMFAGLPALYHPVFCAEGFDSATNDRFWVGIDARDPAFDAPRMSIELLALGATRISFAGSATP